MKTIKYYTPKQVAEIMGVHFRTIHQWIKQGKMDADQPFGKRGRYHVPETAIPAFKRKGKKND